MLNATVIEREDLSAQASFFRIKPDGGVPPFLPGQYATLGLPLGGCGPNGRTRLVKRVYSIGSPPGESGWLEFLVALSPQGEFTSRLAAVRPGDRIFFGGKITGAFTLDRVPRGAPLLLVGTGTGIAPLACMARAASTWERHHEIQLIHGARRESDLAYRAELERLAAQQHGFKYFPVLSSAGSEWPGRRGRVQSLFRQTAVDFRPVIQHVFLCGSPGMISEVTALLVERGFKLRKGGQDGNLHCEGYWRC